MNSPPDEYQTFAFAKFVCFCSFDVVGIQGAVHHLCNYVSLWEESQDCLTCFIHLGSGDILSPIDYTVATQAMGFYINRGAMSLAGMLNS